MYEGVCSFIWHVACGNFMQFSFMLTLRFSFNFICSALKRQPAAQIHSPEYKSFLVYLGVQHMHCSYIFPNHFLSFGKFYKFFFFVSYSLRLFPHQLSQSANIAWRAGAESLLFSWVVLYSTFFFCLILATFFLAAATVALFINRAKANMPIEYGKKSGASRRYRKHTYNQSRQLTWFVAIFKSFVLSE